MTDIREQLLDAGYEPPEGQLEATVARIEADVLDVDRVGRSDSFYDFGGTSLQAIRICARIERETGHQAQPAWLFETDVLSEFVRRLPAGETDAGAPPTPGAAHHEANGLTDGQVAMWLNGLVRPERAVGNVIVLGYRMCPAPSTSALLDAIRAFTARHDALRTAIQANEQGEPEPCPLPLDVALSVEDGGAAEGGRPPQERAEALARRVDIEAGPLMCARVDSVPGGCELLVAVHHACFDGHSEGLLSSELSDLVNGESSPAATAAAAPTIPTRPDPDTLQEWGLRLASTGDIPWPAVDVDPSPGAEAAGVIRFQTTAGASAGLARHARSAGVSPFQVALRAVARVLRGATGAESFCVGVPTSIRDGETDHVVGNFIRQAVVPLGEAELDGPIDAISATWQRAEGALGVSLTELAKLAGRASGTGSRLFQVQLAWQNQPSAGWRIPGVTVTEIDLTPFTAQLDLTVELRPTTGGSVSGLIEYDRQVVADRTASEVAAGIVEWFEQVA